MKDKGYLEKYEVNDLQECLYVACTRGELADVKDLIENHKCDPKAKSLSGADALSFASVFGHLDVVKYLVEECGSDPHAQGELALITAVRSGDLDLVKYLVEEHECSFI